MTISAGLLIDTFTPLTITFTDDSMGGVTETETTGTTFKGRLSSLPVGERLSADKTTVIATHKLYCSPQSFAEKDRIRLGSAGSYRYFEVKGVQNPSNLSDFWQTTLLELD